MTRWIDTYFLSDTAFKYLAVKTGPGLVFEKSAFCQSKLKNEERQIDFSSTGIHLTTK